MNDAGPHRPISDSGALRKQLTQFLLSTGRVKKSALESGMPLITSGLIDSTTLFSLAAWIEETLGMNLDLTQIQLPHDWDTLDRIVLFIEQRQGHDASI